MRAAAATTGTTMPSSSRELGVAAFGIALAGLLFARHRHRDADPLTLHELSALFGAEYDHTILSMSAASSSSGRGLWTLKAVPAGVNVLSIPDTSRLMIDDVLRPGSDLYQELENAATPHILRLALGLLLVLDDSAAAIHGVSTSPQSGVDSVARHWLDYTMPLAPLTSYALFSNELAAAFDSVAFFRVSSHANDGLPAFRKLCAQHMPMVEDGLVRRVYATVVSRAFTARESAEHSASRDDEGSVDVFLTAMLDLANHGAAPNLACVCDGERCWLETTRDIASGEELLVSYGKLPDISLLLRYGFVLGATSNPVGLLLVLGECAIDATGHRLPGSDAAREYSASLRCLRGALEHRDLLSEYGGRDVAAANWVNAECSRLRGQMDVARAGEAAACVFGPDSDSVDPAIRLLKRTWVDLEHSLDACLHGNGEEMRSSTL